MAAAAESMEGEGGAESREGEQARGAAGEGRGVRLGFWAWGCGGGWGIRWRGRVVGGRFRKSVSGGFCKTT
jgi:hypothetical protein